MRLVSWNVAGKIDGPRAARLSAQVQAIAGERPDVVALQEVTRASDPQWRVALPQLGLPHVMSTTCLLAPDRRYANLLASRWPLLPLSFRPDSDNDFPEKLLTARVQPPSAAAVDVHVFHAPTGVGAGWGKVRALEALHHRLARRGGGRVVGRRYDHVLASRELGLLSMSYRHSWRERSSAGWRLSDHSGVVVDFDL